MVGIDFTTYTLSVTDGSSFKTPPSVPAPALASPAHVIVVPTECRSACSIIPVAREVVVIRITLREITQAQTAERVHGVPMQSASLSATCLDVFVRKLVGLEIISVYTSRLPCSLTHLSPRADATIPQRHAETSLDNIRIIAYVAIISTTQSTPVDEAGKPCE
ncbi:hypothetical protein GQ53DRAFT_856426 [Thozetella sp. PMI_491]|nr:hypothetical protein GQ53DRAFT_856426 [Thozetella sp. PMI_491]